MRLFYCAIHQAGWQAAGAGRPAGEAGVWSYQADSQITIISPQERRYLLCINFPQAGFSAARRTALPFYHQFTTRMQSEPISEKGGMLEANGLFGQAHLKRLNPKGCFASPQSVHERTRRPWHITASVSLSINSDGKLITFVNDYLSFLTHHSGGLKKREDGFPGGIH